MPPWRTKSTILVVEDDAELRSLYRGVLVAAGYAVVAVEDGVDALRHVDRDAPAAVVLDLGLPRLHGRDVHRELREHSTTRHIPVVVITGTDLDDAALTDFDCVLRKPIDLDGLVEAVESCLHKLRKR